MSAVDEGREDVGVESEREAEDPLIPRAGRTNKGELVRCPINLVGYAHKQTFTKLELYPAKEIHGSPYPLANCLSSGRVPAI